MATRTLDRIPQDLAKYCVEQDWSRYTPRDHAAWRFIIRRGKSYFKDHAVDCYLKGLRATALDGDQVPRIDDVDRALQKIGWGAVPVRGFIPPWTFMAFQAHRILPVAADMRTIAHLAYTPAPDIVHEAAGHAPILVDERYAAFVEDFARSAAKALYSADDLRLYEAIRYLSDLKENPDHSPEEIAQAEARLAEAVATFTYVSESTRMARAYWWTVEYGLLGSLDKPRIYGAGLLSSVGESMSCLRPDVRKIPLSVACADASYDITKPQPQLFVASDMDHLVTVGRDLTAAMACHRGGMASVEAARDAGAIATVAFEQGLSVSGRIERHASDADGRLAFLKLAGPCQLAHAETELPGQGHARHPHGFSSPLGRWQDLAHKPASQASDEDLRALGLVAGQRATLAFRSGIRVAGRLERVVRTPAGALAYLTWSDCRITWGAETLFDPAWGECDMMVGETAVSVWGGPADRLAFGEHEIVDSGTQPNRQSPFSADERQTFAAYATVAASRQGGRAVPDEASLAALARAELAKPQPEWLLLLEIWELGQNLSLSRDAKATWWADIAAYLRDGRHFDPETAALVHQGLAMATSPDPSAA